MSRRGSDATRLAFGARPNWTGWALIALSAVAAGCGGDRVPERTEVAEPFDSVPDAGPADVVVELADGRRIWFRGDTTPGNGFHIYEDEGVVEAIDAHVIRVRLYEGGVHALVHRVTGDTAWLVGPPVVSPSGNRVAAASVDLIAEFDPNALQIFAVRGGHFVEELAYRPEAWGPSDARWVAEDTLSFLKNTVNERLEYETEPGLAIRSGASWQVLVGDVVGSPPSGADGPLAADTGTVAVNGTRLFYEERGEGPVVVLIHGGNLDRRMWDPQLEPLARDHRVIRYDVRGYGRSGPADAPYRSADDLYALLRALEVRRASLVGLSLGGRIAMDFALDHPGMVDRLVLAAPGLSGWKSSNADTAYFPAARRARDEGDAAALGLAWLGSRYMLPAMEHPELVGPLREMAAANGKATC